MGYNLKAPNGIRDSVIAESTSGNTTGSFLFVKLVFYLSFIDFI